jgi:REP element-mobilizing transposase RayT
MWQHIKENAKLKGIYIDCINGYNDHCHCLISLETDQTLQQIMQLIKGESSFWFNKEKEINSKFEWQNEYFAASVSERMIERTRNYIKGQEKHHDKESSQQEYDNFLLRCGFRKFSDNM